MRPRFGKSGAPYALPQIGRPSGPLSGRFKKHIAEYGHPDVLFRTALRDNLIRRDHFNAKIWKPAIKAAGLLTDTTFHDLRHTFASAALAEGVPISEVSK